MTRMNRVSFYRPFGLLPASGTNPLPPTPPPPLVASKIAKIWLGVRFGGEAI